MVEAMRLRREHGAEFEEFVPGDIVQHFKREMLEDADNQQYLYRIIAIAQTTNRSQDELMIYQALYGNFQTYARPLHEFMSEVDHEKYPDIQQLYRFERCVYINDKVGWKPVYDKEDNYEE